MVQVSIQSKNFAIVLQGVREIDARVLDAAELALSRGLQMAVGISQKEYLRGPRPQRLGVVTSRLFNSIASDVRRNETGVVGRIGSNVRYARYHEFGFHGVVTVKGHSRIMGVVGKGGRVLKGGVRRTTDTSAPQSVIQIVKAHSRRVDYDGRPFIRPALERALPIIGREIENALNKT